MVTNKRKNIISGFFDKKIQTLIFAFLEQQKLELKNNKTDLMEILNVQKIFEFININDFQLRRIKKTSLEKSILKVITTIVENKHLYFSNELSDNNKGTFDKNICDINSLDNQEYMLVKDNNSLNKSIVSLWNNDESTELKKRMTNETQIGLETSRTDSKKKKNINDKSYNFVKKKSKIEHTLPGIKLSSLGGIEEIIDKLLELIGLPIMHPELFASIGIIPPKGILLYGPHGCGKSTLAHAIAGEFQVPFISISAPSIVSGMSGESEKNLREIFEEAKLIAPSIIFIDEIDVITPKRDSAQREMERRIVAQLLTLMDDLTLDKTNGKNVIIIGATNRPDALDPALRRSGRFDTEICMNVPNEEQRFSILKKITKYLNLKDFESFNFKQLSKMTPGFVGADLKSLVSTAGLIAIKRVLKILNHNHKNQSDLCLTANEQINSSDIQIFLKNFIDPLSLDQLSSLQIIYSDFINALTIVQPSSKREGFSTIPDITWKDVGALNNIRMEMHMCIVQPIKKPELFLKVGISRQAGVLLWGPPGCGKTLLAKAVANESKANFISVKGPELLNKYVGESEKAIRQVFQRARMSIPCIIFFDELDALVPKRDSLSSESSSRVVNTLLTELDGLDNRIGVFVIGATNRPDIIDSAMLRPGRLDKTLYVDLPTSIEKFEILNTLINVNKTPLSPCVNLREIANNELCKNFSGADLLSLVREASVLALKRSFFKGQEINHLDASGFYENDNVEQEIFVTSNDFYNALTKIKPSVNDADREKYRMINEQLISSFKTK